MFKKLINKFKKKKKEIERKFSLIHVYTFPTGEKLYTYKAEDWGNISSRYYRNVQESIKYLQTFLLTKNEWESAVKKCKELCKEAVKKRDNTEDVMQVYNSLDWFERKMVEARTSNEIVLEMLFCMFYLLEDEQEFGYSPIHNEKKIELLNQNIEMKDFFLTNLKKVSNDLMPTSREDILQMIVTLQKTQREIFGNMQEK